VIQVLPLEENSGTYTAAEPGGFGDRRWSADELVKQVFQLAPECRVSPGAVIDCRQLIERGDESFGYVAATIGAKPA
jgi:hypothetical protein